MSFNSLAFHLKQAERDVIKNDFIKAIEALRLALKLANALGRHDIKRHIFIALNVLRPLIQK